nr:uncharacterized protein LOC109746908 [Aegilops tauschii subsp. strangulata]
MFAAACAVTIGDGNRANFWYDSWLPEGAPFLLVPELFAASRRKTRTVCQALASGKWVQDLRGRVKTELLPAFVKLWVCIQSRQPLITGTGDVFRWRLTENSVYSAASAYSAFFIASTTFPLRQEIWAAWAPAKCRIFAWLLTQRRILTADRLLARQWPNSYFCPLCIRNLETAAHLAVECTWSRELWGLVANRFRVPELGPELWTDHSSLSAWLSGMSSCPATRKLARSAALLILWWIWKERNTRIFERGAERSPRQVLQLLLVEASEWALAGGRHLSLRE